MLIDDGRDTGSFATEANGEESNEWSGDGAKAMVLLKGADCCDLCPCYAACDGESVVGQRALDMGNGLLVLKVLKFASQQEWVKDVGDMAALGLGLGLGLLWLGLWLGRGGEESLFDRLCVNSVADFLVSGLVKLAAFVIVSSNRMRATRACFFGIHDDKNEPVFGKFAGCNLLATALASFEAAFVAFVFPHMGESFSRCAFGFHHFALKLVVVASRENLGFRHFFAGGMRHPVVIRRIIPHSTADVEEIVFAVEVMDSNAFAEGIGVLDRLVAGSDVAATSVGAGGFFATLFDECSLRWDICGVEIGVTIVGAHDDECFGVLREHVFHFVKQVA